MPQPIKNRRTQIGTLAGVPTQPTTGRIRTQSHANSASAGREMPSDYSKRDVAKGDAQSPPDRYTEIGGEGIAVARDSIHGTGAKTTSDMQNSRGPNQLNKNRKTVDVTNVKVGQASEVDD